MKLLPYGPRALLVEFDSLAEVMAAAATWRGDELPGVVDIVPAARTVLVVHDGALDPDALRAPNHPAARRTSDQLITLDVTYDGEDLSAVAEAVKLSVDDVVRIHSDTEYEVAFCGFLPGFSYLIGLDSRLVLPRRATPRTRVPTGSVAIAAEFTAVYPQESPGGWHLLGHTDATMWDDDRDPPALLPPGTRVRFRPR